jgi:hypothetical protein
MDWNGHLLIQRSLASAEWIEDVVAHIIRNIQVKKIVYHLDKTYKKMLSERTLKKYLKVFFKTVYYNGKCF